MDRIILLFIALKRHFANKKVRIAYLALFVAIIITVVYNQELDRADRDRQYRNLIAKSDGFDHDQACYALQEKVTSNLISPATAQFPIRTKWKKAKQNDVITIESYVDSENSLGALIRTRFIGYFKQNKDSKWYMYDIKEMK